MIDTILHSTAPGGVGGWAADPACVWFAAVLPALVLLHLLRGSR